MTKNVQKTVKWTASIVLPLLLFFIPVNESFTPEIRNFFISTSFVIFLWALELMPFVIPALMLPIFYVVIGIAPTHIAFAPWGHYIPWMLLSGMILTNIFEEVGLLKRISYWCILRAGGHFHGLLYGLMFSGVIVALLLPDIASRTVLFVAIAYGICKALNLEPYSKSATAVMLVGVMTALTPGYIFYTSAAQTLIAWDMAAKSGFEITWFNYLLYNGLPTLIWCFLTVAIIQVMFRSKEVDAEQCRECFQEELRNLGKLSRNEKKLSLVAAALCLFAATGNLHGIAVGWGFVAAVFVCYLPGINLGREYSSNAVNYGLIIFVASCMAIGTVSNHIGAGTFVANQLQPYLSGSQLHIMSTSWLMAVLLNFVMTPLAAVSTLSGPLAEIVQQTETAIVPVLYAWNQGLEQIILPYEYALILLAFGYGYISIKPFIKFFSVRMVANFVFLWVIYIPFCMLIGLI
ncbi:MAG: anion permease [Desulfohalobiaceae bacterium]|nr:anion permease [Desulfohalobiaceae bacterium]